MPQHYRHPAAQLDNLSRQLKRERQISFTQGVWLGLVAGASGTAGALFLIFRTAVFGGV